MTLVAARIEDDYVEILTDTLAFADTHFVRYSKIEVVPHLDMAFTGRGPAELMQWWKWWRDSYTDLNEVSSLDDLQALAPDVLRECWEKVPAKEQSHRAVGHVINAGWSEAQQRFVGFDHQSDDDFEPVPLRGFLVFPALPSEHASPVSDADWIAVAEAAYADAGYGIETKRCPFGGDLILTRLERGSASHRRIHTLPQDDWRFRQMLLGSLHRFGQLGPCTCGSGKPFILCHLALAPPGWPCPCLAGRADGKPFHDCHRVDPDDPESHRHWEEHHDHDVARSADYLAETWQKQMAADPEMAEKIASMAEHSRRLEQAQATPPPAPPRFMNRRDRRAAARRSR